MDPYIIHTEGGQLAAGCTQADVQRIVSSALGEKLQNGIAIHFHGGLVSERSGREIAARLEPEYRKAGVAPIFMVWESHLLETIRNNGAEIARETLFRLLAGRVEDIVGRKFSQSGGDRSSSVLPPGNLDQTQRQVDAALESASVPGSNGVAAPDGLTELNDREQRQVELELELDRDLRLEIEAVGNGLADPAIVAAAAMSRSPGSRASSRTMMDPAVVLSLVESRGPGDRGFVSALKVIKAIVKIAARVIHRYIKKRDHGLHATVVEEILREFYFGNIGGYLWEKMKGDTADAFKPDPSKFGGTALVDALRASPHPLPKISLIGHSTGAIYIAHFLQSGTAALGNRATYDVIFLAAAITCELWNEAVLATSAKQQIRGYRSFGMSDVLERKDVLLRGLPFVYPSSLLYIVSGLFERKADTPLVGMQRYFNAQDYRSADFPHVDAMRAFAALPTHRSVWSSVAAGSPGCLSTAQSHGAFDEDPLTLQSLQHILQVGF